MKHTDDHDERMDASMDCERALELVPTFVDGEASESLAGAMRKHLMECHDCRSAVQEETGLHQWFEPLAGEAGLADVEVPPGFAARVTELAFGELALAGSSAGSSAGSHAFQSGGALGQERRGPRPLRSVSPAASTAPGEQAEEQEESSTLGFLMGMTAMAAALMVGFTLMLAQDSRPEVGDKPLSATSFSLEEGLREIEAENAAQAAALENSNPETVAPADDSDADKDEQQDPGDENPK